MKDPKIVPSNLVHWHPLKSFRTNTALLWTRRRAVLMLNPLLIIILVLAATTAATAQTLKVLHYFGSTSGDAQQPTEELIAQGRDGNLYSTSFVGGAYGLGTVFKVTPAGNLTVLYSFDGTQGSNPSGGLILGTDGNFYGTTFLGGPLSNGTIFKITSKGLLTTLYNFTGGDDGGSPYAAPVQGADGNFYGSTCACPYGEAYTGTLYRLTPSGELTTLYHLGHSPITDGVNPENQLVQGIDGSFYGTATNQGTYDRGTIFRITLTGEFTPLHSFYDPSGSRTNAPLFQADDGNFYATAEHGGDSNYGVVYRISPSGEYTALHSFVFSDGNQPFAGLVPAPDGNLYGTAVFGGVRNSGTIFRFGLDGSFSVLYNFDVGRGREPYGTPVLHTNGSFYGTTFAGGSHGLGVFYRFDLGLAPFVRLVNTSGKVGTPIRILGQGFNNTTAVSFNGTPATFKVWADTFLTATVPNGAAGGFVTVTTPSGTLTSNEKFRVRPVILTVAPDSGPPGTPVVITGTSFTQTTKVVIGGVPAASFTVDSDSQVTATVPAGASTGYVVLTTEGSKSRSPDTFVVTP